MYYIYRRVCPLDWLKEWILLTEGEKEIAWKIMLKPVSAGTIIQQGEESRDDKLHVARGECPQRHYAATTSSALVLKVHQYSVKC